MTSPRRVLPAPVVVLALLLTQTGSGSRWTAATVQTDGGRVTSRLDLRGASSPVVLSSRVYVDGALVSTANLTLRAAGGGRGIVVRTPPVAGVEVRVEQGEDDSAHRFGELSATLVLNPEGPVRRGRVSLVLYAAAAAVDGWTWGLSAAPGPTTVLGTGSGPEAFAHTSRDFTSAELSAYAGHTVPDLATVSARANLGARKVLQLDPRFMGSYATLGTDRLAVRGPEGVRQCTPGCTFEPTDRTTRLRSSTYTFTLDGSGVGVHGTALQQTDTDVSLHGALVRPPHEGRL